MTDNRKYNYWYCGECSETLMVETPKNEDMIIHCCFLCGSNSRAFIVEPIIWVEPKTFFDLGLCDDGLEEM